MTYTISEIHDSILYPETIEQVQSIVKDSLKKNFKVRVCGSGRSEIGAIYVDNKSNGVNISLAKINTVKIDKIKRIAVVGGGCHLGEDKTCWHEGGKFENTLSYHLEKNNFALKALPAISHQTIVGMLATGSCGSTLYDSIYEQVIEYKIVNGKGELLCFRKDNNPEMFYACLISMGLCGIIVEVSFILTDSYCVKSTNAVYKYKNSPINLLSDPIKTIEKFFKQHEHARLFWFPQKGIEKIGIWTARTCKTKHNTKFKPYNAITSIQSLDLLMQKLIAKVMNFLTSWFYTEYIEKNKKPQKSKRYIFERILIPFLHQIIYRANSKIEEFHDIWWRGIAMDDYIDERILKTRFMEVCIPLENTKNFAKDLQTLFNKLGYKATGVFCIEVYVSKSNLHYLSPHNGRDSMKFDWFWYPIKNGSPLNGFFNQFEDIIIKNNGRYHWGKMIIKNPTYISESYENFAKFKKIRETMDPNDIFLNKYWQEHMDI